MKLVIFDLGGRLPNSFICEIRKSQQNILLKNIGVL